MKLPWENKVLRHNRLIVLSCNPALLAAHENKRFHFISDCLFVKFCLLSRRLFFSCHARKSSPTRTTIGWETLYSGKRTETRKSRTEERRKFRWREKFYVVAAFWKFMNSRAFPITNQNSNHSDYVESYKRLRSITRILWELSALSSPPPMTKKLFQIEHMRDMFVMINLSFDCLLNRLVSCLPRGTPQVALFPPRPAAAFLCELSIIHEFGKRGEMTSGKCRKIICFRSRRALRTPALSRT